MFTSFKKENKKFSKVSCGFNFLILTAVREVSEREGVTGIDGRLFFLLFVRFSGVLISYFAAQPVVVNLLRSVTQRGGTQTAIHPFHCQEQKGTTRGETFL